MVTNEVIKDLDRSEYPIALLSRDDKNMAILKNRAPAHRWLIHRRLFPSRRAWFRWGMIASVLCAAYHASPLHAAPGSLSLAVMADGGTECPAPSLARYAFGQASALDVAPLEHTFVLRNDNSVPLTVERFQASCGCTSAVVGGAGVTLPLTVAPHQVIRVHVSVDPAHLSAGVVSKDVWVYARGQAAPAITLEMNGVVQPLASFSPPVADFGRGTSKVARPILLTVTLDRRLISGTNPLHLISSDPDILITAVPAPPAPLGADLSKETADASVVSLSGTTRTYRLTLAPKAHLGVLNAALSLVPATSGSPKASPSLAGATVPIVGEVIGDIAASPAAFAFGTVGAGQGAVQRVLLTGATPAALTGLRVTCGSPYLSARLRRPDPVQQPIQQPSAPPSQSAVASGKMLLELSVSPRMPAETLETQVIVTTTHGERLVLPVYVSVVGSAGSG